jgi:hypothetical protein
MFRGPAGPGDMCASASFFRPFATSASPDATCRLTIIALKVQIKAVFLSEHLLKYIFVDLDKENLLENEKSCQTAYS